MNYAPPRTFPRIPSASNRYAGGGISAALGAMDGTGTEAPAAAAGAEFLVVETDCLTGATVTTDLTGATYDAFAAFLTMEGLKGVVLRKTGTPGTETIILGATKLTATRTFVTELSVAPATTGTFFVKLTFSDTALT